ncbi:MAG: DUF721 domain-containing protein [Rhodospirillales bacterium]|nr:MAG: DUF721 domain-containing protein [Rhodospirillales bacterium]UCH74368.1 MAG: DUF721 domain-containing protein [Rhodospirillales bacterium]
MTDRPKQAKDGGKRGGGPRPLAATLGGIAGRTLGRRGFAEGGLIADWRAVVGPELAASCWPDRIRFPRGRTSGGELRIRVAGGLATELQHLVPQLLERINGHFGYRAIDRITILQAPPDAAMAARARARARPPGNAKTPGADDESLAAALAAVDDPEIRAALARLGRAMISEGHRDRGD